MRSEHTENTKRLGGCETGKWKTEACHTRRGRGCEENGRPAVKSSPREQAEYNDQS